MFFILPQTPINLNILNSDFRGSSDGAFSIRGNWKLIKLSNNIFELKTPNQIITSSIHTTS